MSAGDNMGNKGSYGQHASMEPLSTHDGISDDEQYLARLLGMAAYLTLACPINKSTWCHCERNRPV